jgi:hypothetical protein
MASQRNLVEIIGLERAVLKSLDPGLGDVLSQIYGSSGRTRTYNPPVNSRMLCH